MALRSLSQNTPLDLLAFLGASFSVYIKRVTKCARAVHSRVERMNRRRPRVLLYLREGTCGKQIHHRPGHMKKVTAIFQIIYLALCTLRVRVFVDYIAQPWANSARFAAVEVGNIPAVGSVPSGVSSRRRSARLTQRWSVCLSVWVC